MSNTPLIPAPMDAYDLIFERCRKVRRVVGRIRGEMAGKYREGKLEVGKRRGGKRVRERRDIGRGWTGVKRG